MITSISCIRTYLGIRHHQNQLHAQQIGGNQFITGRYKKSINTITFIFCLLLACYLPYFTAVGIFMATASNSDTTLAFNTTAGIVYLNSLLNPILYCWRIIKRNQGGGLDRSTSVFSRSNICGQTFPRCDKKAP